MKSFSSAVKDHIAAKSLEEVGIGEKDRTKWKDCCVISHLNSALLFLGKKTEGQYRLSSRWVNFLESIAFSLIRSFSCEAKLLEPQGGKMGFEIPPEKAEQILDLAKKTPMCARCKELFVRAAFLSCGTMLDPAKGYHASFAVENPNNADRLISVLEDLGVFAKQKKSAKGILVYLKESSQIEDLLSAMGAQKFSLELMNQKIEKSIRADINRRQNFDDANLRKTVNGAQSVILAIRKLEQKNVLETLSEPLQKAAKLRMSYPEVSLKELCERSEDEITKSGLNHRLQKLLHLAETLEKKEEEL